MFVVKILDYEVPLLPFSGVWEKTEGGERADKRFCTPQEVSSSSCILSDRSQGSNDRTCFKCFFHFLRASWIARLFPGSELD